MDDDRTEDDKIQQKYLKFKTLQQRVQEIEEYLEALQQQQQELHNTIRGVKGLSKISPDTEVLAPLSNGIFVKTKLQENSALIVNVGANITVEKSLPEVIALLEQQAQELQEKVPLTQAVLQELQTQVQQQYEELQQKIKEP